MAVDGKVNILDIKPNGYHHRLPLFAGSKDDILEILTYENIQQTKISNY